MHIEFRLPSGAGGMAAGHAARVIRKQLNEWHAKHGISFTTRADGYKFIVELPTEQDYSFFRLSFDPCGFYSPSWDRIKIVDNS